MFVLICKGHFERGQESITPGVMGRRVCPVCGAMIRQEDAVTMTSKQWAEVADKYLHTFKVTL